MEATGDGWVVLVQLAQMLKSARIRIFFIVRMKILKEKIPPTTFVGRGLSELNNFSLSVFPKRSLALVAEVFQQTIDAQQLCSEQAAGEYGQAHRKRKPIGYPGHQEQDQRVAYL